MFTPHARVEVVTNDETNGMVGTVIDGPDQYNTYSVLLDDDPSKLTAAFLGDELKRA